MKNYGQTQCSNLKPTHSRVGVVPLGPPEGWFSYHQPRIEEAGGKSNIKVVEGLKAHSVRVRRESDVGPDGCPKAYTRGMLEHGVLSCPYGSATKLPTTRKETPDNKTLNIMLSL